MRSVLLWMRNEAKRVEILSITIENLKIYEKRLKNLEKLLNLLVFGPRIPYRN